MKNLCAFAGLYEKRSRGKTDTKCISVFIEYHHGDGFEGIQRRGKAEIQSRNGEEIAGYTYSSCSYSILMNGQ